MFTRLKPFTAIDDIEVHGRIEAVGDQLIVEFLLKDPQNRIEDSLRPGQWKTWERADELWKTTCFEAFIGVQGEARYWELNLSPALQKWNLYSFDGYRSPQPPRTSDTLELASIAATANSLTCGLHAKIALNRLEASLNAVIRTREGVNYFALKHAGLKPDFHLRESFVWRES